MQIQLTYTDISNNKTLSPKYNLPLAIGRKMKQGEASKIPDQLNAKPLSKLFLDDSKISSFHCLIDLHGTDIFIEDQQSSNGTYINSIKITSRQILNNGDRIKVGSYDNIQVDILIPPQVNNTPTILFNPATNKPDSTLLITTPSNQLPNCLHYQQILINDIHATGLPVDEKDYVTIGAGLGSFIWADYLRIYGVKANQIMALGIDDKPYHRYQTLCHNSQIPPHERLRSNSDSCPDNIWGWPSYAIREAARDFYKLNLGNTLTNLWKVFAEPTFAETYTPISNNVFKSIDREAARIGWNQIYKEGRVLAIRKAMTKDGDGRYVVYYSLGNQKKAFVIARYLHLAIGYPAIKFLPQFQDYRSKYNDFKSIVNAYEEHEHIYQYLIKNGGTVLIQGRGIVASRIIQKLYEISQNHHKKITIIHLIRGTKMKGSKYGLSQRDVRHHVEIQPFNWPKACWGGQLRYKLETASPAERKKLISGDCWGGTTTALRADWERIIQLGSNEKWYDIKTGEMIQLERKSTHPTLIKVTIKEDGFPSPNIYEVNYIIEATGLEASADSSPLVDDLIKFYNLQPNIMNRLSVNNNFEVEGMRSGNRRMYASGALTFGGPYAAVDSFLGLQYTALRSVDDLAQQRAPNLASLNMFSSFDQWLKWVFNQSPS